MKFNGIDMTQYFRVNNIVGRGIAPNELAIIEVPRMDGAYYSSSRRPARVIDVDITVEAYDRVSLREKLDEINAILNVSEPSPVVFDDEPNMTYYGVPEYAVDSLELSDAYQGTISIICPDPYKYGSEEVKNFVNDGVSFSNVGSAEANPIITLDVLKPITFATVQNHNDEYLMIGEQVTVDTTPFESQTLVLRDNCSTTSGWTVGTQVDNGVVSGTMVSNGSSFVASSYGADSINSWHGPALKKSLSEPLVDFRMDVLIEQIGDLGNEVGRVEIYLLDVHNNIIAKTAMKDTKTSMRLNEAEVRVGTAENGHHLVHNEYGRLMTTWRNFKGILRLQRERGKWTSYIGIIEPDGTHRARMTRHFQDEKGMYGAAVAQIQVHIATSKSYSPTQQKINDIKVYKINQRKEAQIPYIATAGDTITLDHKNNDILINGEPRMELKDFGATFFSLQKGTNQLVVMPGDSFDARINYRNKYR